MNTKKGFTMVELTIVIAVIGLITAILLPRFGSISNAAKAAQVQGNLTTLRTSIAMFEARTGETPAKITENENNLYNVTSSTATGSVRFIEYYSSNEIASTPSFSRTGINEETIVVPSKNDILASGKYENGFAKGFDGTGGWLWIPNKNGTSDIYANLIPFKQSASAGGNNDAPDLDSGKSESNDMSHLDPFQQGIDWTKF